MPFPGEIRICVRNFKSICTATPKKWNTVTQRPRHTLIQFTTTQYDEEKNYNINAKYIKHIKDDTYIKLFKHEVLKEETSHSDDGGEHFYPGTGSHVIKSVKSSIVIFHATY